MKKLPFRKRKEDKKAIPTRITNETVAEHRERILAGGRRFKYPMQYARHRLVFNTVLVTIVALVMIVVVGWWQLYPAQNTSSFFYRVTRVVPLPVATVDGESVPYSDYLMYYNSSSHYLQQSEQVNPKTEDGKRQLNYMKRKSIDNAEADAYAKKLSRTLGITVDDAQIDKVVSDARNTANGRISQETYDASALNILGWTPPEYRQATKSKLIRQAVSYAVDTAAKEKQEKTAELLAAKKADFSKVAKALGGTGEGTVSTGTSGMVPRTNSDGGLSAAAANLEKGKISSVIKTTTGDGYYFVRLLEKTDTQVSYEYIRIPLTAFNEKFAALKKDGKIKEYITVPSVDNKTTK